MAKIGHKTCITWPQCDFWIQWPIATWPWPWPWPVLSMAFTLIQCIHLTFVFRPSLGLFESSWRFWQPKCGNAQFWPLTWPWPDTRPFKKNFKSALEPSRRDLSNAASPVSLRSLVWELAWPGGGALYAPPPPVNGVRLRPRSSAG